MWQRNPTREVGVPEYPVKKYEYTIRKNACSLEHKHLHTILFLKRLSICLIAFIERQKGSF